MGLREISTILWDERQLMDLLLFKLEEEYLLLVAARHQWLPRAASEVDFVLERIAEAETARSAEVALIAAEFGLDGSPTLGQIADSVPEPWATTLRDHRTAFTTAVRRIQELADRNREFLSRHLAAISDTLYLLAGPEGGRHYSSDGASGIAGNPSRLVDAKV